MIHGKHQGYGYGKPDESKSKVHDEKVRVCGNVRALALESNDNE